MLAPHCTCSAAHYLESEETISIYIVLLKSASVFSDRKISEAEDFEHAAWHVIASAHR